jgi:hypothetical protein
MSATRKLLPTNADYHIGFVATADDANARVSFAVGAEAGTLYVGGLELKTGGQRGLDAPNEDPAQVTVASYSSESAWTRPRSSDWFDFLQQTDEAYWVGMRDFLKNELKVQAPVTGTIGLGPLGTLSQSKMDFVDAHAYWDHPQFPGRAWSASNWTIKNTPMVDNPAGSPVWNLAATRVAGKPFTVTEYNHAAPNDWQAEAVPMIATIAALQDWDAVFLFAYSHANQMEKDKQSSFFDIEGNPAKMLAMPAGARIFLGQSVQPSDKSTPLNAYRAELLAHGAEDYYQINRTWNRAMPDFWKRGLYSRLLIAFHDDVQTGTLDITGRSPLAGRLQWGATGSGSGKFRLSDTYARAWVGFGSTGDPGVQFETPFASMALVPADPSKSVKEANRLLLTAIARTQNPGMTWNEQRTSVSTNWGKAPPQVEVVKGTLKLDADYTVRALDSAGKVIKEFATENQTVRLGEAPTVWYELVRK